MEQTIVRGSGVIVSYRLGLLQTCWPGVRATMVQFDSGPRNGRERQSPLLQVLNDFYGYNWALAKYT